MLVAKAGIHFQLDGGPLFLGASGLHGLLEEQVGPAHLVLVHSILEVESLPQILRCLREVVLHAVEEERDLISSGLGGSAQGNCCWTN